MNAILQELRGITSTPKELRKFGFVVGGVVIVASFLVSSWGSAIIGGVLIVSALSIPRALTPFYYVWMTFGIVMGMVMSAVILITVFYVILTPLAVIARMSGRDELLLKRQKRESYWRARSDISNSNELTEQY
ncbi:MAG: SxtJ family membrane protein [Patescibacteria group bacterium]